MRVLSPPVLPAGTDEAAIRHLCGAAAFARADELQRAGHVRDVTFSEHVISGLVRGTWRRVDRVAIEVRGARLHPSCARDGAEFCRHSGALLLQCLREPESVEHILPADELLYPPPARVETDELLGTETAAAQLERFLAQDTVAHLREIARRRGVRVSGTKKADIAAQLAPVLADPAGIDAVSASLPEPERLALDAVHLLSGELPAASDTLGKAFRLLGGSGEPPLSALHDLGLVISHNQLYGYYGAGNGYVVTRAIAERLPAMEGLARPAAGSITSGERGTARGGMLELLLTVAHEAGERGLSLRRLEPGDQAGIGTPQGFLLDPAERASVSNPNLLYHAREPLRLVPLPPWLIEADMERLTARTRQPAEAVDLAVGLLLTTTIAEGTTQLVVHEDRLQQLLSLPPNDRLLALASAWLSHAWASTIKLVSGERGDLSARWLPAWGYWGTPLQPAIDAAADLVATLVGRLPADTWLDLRSFVATVERLAPVAAPNFAALTKKSPGQEALSIWMRGSRGEQQLSLRSKDGWERFVAALVTALLDGPLAWLGLVEVRQTAAGAALRAAPAAAMLAGRAVAADDGAAERLVVGNDLTVTVPLGSADPVAHGLLARAGLLVDVAGDGLRYRLTAGGVQELFDTGTSWPELERFLVERSGAALPRATRAALDAWWKSYGRLRLYDELDLLELGDDLLLRELQVATSLGGAIVQQLGPRLLAIDPAMTARVVAELAARGYAPRIIEGA